MSTCICCGDSSEDSSFCRECEDKQLGHKGGEAGLKACKKRIKRQKMHIPLGYGMQTQDGD